jgi:hypothetical protein
MARLWIAEIGENATIFRNDFPGASGFWEISRFPFTLRLVIVALRWLKRGSPRRPMMSAAGSTDCR